MELYQLKTFAAVAKAGHLTRAAEKLNTSQPAVSAHIKALEDELGVVLFERTPKGMKLTPQGLVMREKADQVLQAADAMRFAAEHLQGELSGDVRLGMHTDPQYLRTTRILAEMKREYPNVGLSYIPKMTWEAPGELHDDKLEAAFAYACPEDDAIAAHKLDQIGLVIVGPITWQDRLHHAVLSDLAAYPWIWTSHQCPLFAVAQNLFDEMDCEPTKAVITDQESAIRHMVANGVGLSIMTELEARSAAAKGKLYIVGSRIATLDLWLLYLKRRAQDPLVKAVLGSIAKAWQVDHLYPANRVGAAEGVA